MTAKILLIDIERVQGFARVPFWSMNEYKNRRLSPIHVVSWPRTICFAYRWKGEKDVKFHAEWDEVDFLKVAWDLFDEADIVVGHNINSFDNKKLRSEWALRKFGPPSPYKTFDTYRVAARAWGFESNTLDALGMQLGIGRKTDKYDSEVTAKALEGDLEARRRLQYYNEGDVDLLEALYDVVKVWGNHPNMGLYNEGRVCPSCGSNNIQSRGTAVTGVAKYQRYHCQDCGKWSRDKHLDDSTEIRGIE